MISTQYIALAILIFCIVFFLTEWIPTTLTCMIGCMLFVLFDVCSFSEAFSGFSNSIVILVFGMMVVGDAMFNSGVAQTIGRKVMQIAGNNERKFILIAGIASAVLSAFLANVAVIAMFMAIMTSISKTNKDVRLKNICLATSMAAMFGGACTLVGSTPQLTVQSIIEGQVGQTFAMWDFLPVGTILTVVYLAYVLTIGYPLGKKIWGKDVEIEDNQAEISTENIEQKLTVGTRRQQLSMVLILAIMIFLFVTEKVSNAMTACICAALCVLTGCTSEKKIFRNVDWGTLFRLAGCLGIGAGIDKSGCGELIANAFISLFGANLHPQVFLAGVVFVVMLISNFISNSTAVFIVLPPVLVICTEFAFNPMAYAIAVSYGSALCFATPLANAQTAMTMVAGYKFSDYFKYNMLLEILVFAVLVLIVPLFWPLAL